MIRAVLIFLVRIYQACISPLTGPRCRFHPTCSSYAIQAIERFGAFKGSWMALKRLIKCQPFTKSGFYDPVPEICHKKDETGKGNKSVKDLEE